MSDMWQKRPLPRVNLNRAKLWYGSALSRSSKTESGSAYILSRPSLHSCQPEIENDKAVKNF